MIAYMIFENSSYNTDDDDNENPKNLQFIPNEWNIFETPFVLFGDIISALSSFEQKLTDDSDGKIKIWKFIIPSENVLSMYEDEYLHSRVKVNKAFMEEELTDFEIFNNDVTDDDSWLCIYSPYFVKLHKEGKTDIEVGSFGRYAALRFHNIYLGPIDKDLLDSQTVDCLIKVSSEFIDAVRRGDIQVDLTEEQYKLIYGN
jgi:hypothetical protein